MSTTRVLLIDAHEPARRRLSSALREAPAIALLEEARDPRLGLALVEARRPDVVVLGWRAPVAEALGAIEQIMAFCPTPILVVADPAAPPGERAAREALSAGAVDSFEVAPADAAAWARALEARVRLVARVPVITHPRARLVPPGARAATQSTARGAGRPYELVAIGASTGGPAALAALLAQLPPHFPLPILVVLHLGEPFGTTFAEWLAGRSPVPVAVVDAEMALPRPGRPGVWIAPPGRHLLVASGALRLTNGPERLSCRPSVDVLFESVAEELGARAIGCLLTGMGRDGALGLLAMRQAGGATIAQDEASSVVYGMPRAACQLGAAERVLGLDRIGETLLALAAGAPRQEE